MPVNEQEFLARAIEKGFSKEQANLYLQRKKAPVQPTAPKKIPTEFAKPSFDVPYSVRKPVRDLIVSQFGSYRNPENIPSYFPKNLDVEQTAKIERTLRNTLSNQRIVDLAKEIKANPFTQNGINAIYNHAQRRDEGIQEQTKLLANLQEIANIDRPFKWIKSKFDTAADAEWRSIQQQNIASIKKLGADRGLEIEYRDGEFFSIDKSGTADRITPGFLDSIEKSKYEVLGGLSGVAAASKIPVPHPLAKLGILALGGLIGTVAGEEVDYLSAAIQAQEKLDAKIGLEKAIGAAQTSILFDVLGATVFQLTPAAARGIRAAYAKTVENLEDGAFALLKDATKMNDDQIREVVSNWEHLNNIQSRGANLKEQALEVIPVTQPGGETIVKGTKRVDPKVPIDVQVSIDNRATTALNAAKNNNKTAEELIQAIDEYKKVVVTNYNNVKEDGGIFDGISRVSLKKEPEIIALIKNLDFRAKTPADERQLNKLHTGLTNLINNKQFSNLLDLKEFTENFKVSNTIAKTDTVAKDILNDLVKTLDSSISEHVAKVPANSKWLPKWKKAEKSFNKYREFKTNSISKLIDKPGVTAKEISKGLIKYGTALDGTFEKFTKALPKNVQISVENEIIDQLSKTRVIGNPEGFKALDFVGLSEDLKLYNLQSSKATTFKRAIDEFAKVYRNDKKLFNDNATLVQSVGQGLATTIEGKVKMAAMQSIWTRVKSLGSSSQAKANALVTQAAKFLKNPLDKDVAERVFKALEGDEQAVQAAQEFSRRSAMERGANSTTNNNPIGRSTNDNF